MSDARDALASRIGLEDAAGERLRWLAGSQLAGALPAQFGTARSVAARGRDGGCLNPRHEVLLAFVVCYLLVPGIGLGTIAGHLWLGAGLALFMGGFDVAMGKLLLRRSWAKAFSDFNPATGNLLIFGLALLAVFPALVALLRGLP